MDLKKLSKVADECRVADMANLYKRTTGVNTRIWISSSYEKHNPRIKADLGDIEVSISISSNPEILAPKNVNLDGYSKLLSQIKEWVKLNEELLLEYWENPKLDMAIIFDKIQKVESK